MTAESSQGKNGVLNKAALEGASMAFQTSSKPTVKPKPLVNTYSGTNGALAAATKVGAARPNAGSRQSSIAAEESGGRLASQRSGGSLGNYGPASPYTPGSSHLDPHTGFLQLPDGERKSPSFIAAALAASRSVTPNHTGQQQQLSAAQQNQLSAALQRQGSYSSVRSGSSRASAESKSPRLDTTSIPPTGSLIGMFEQNAGKGNKRPGLRRAGTVDRDVDVHKVKRAMTPSPRVVKGGREEGQETRPDVGTPTPRSLRPRLENTKKPEIKSPKPTLPSTFANKSVEGPMPPEIKSPKPTLPSTFSNRPLETPKVPLSRRKTPLTKAKPDPPKQVQAIRKSSIPASKPIPIPPKPRYVKEHPPSDSASSEDSFVSATEYHPSFRAELRNQNNRRLASSSSPSHAAAPSKAEINALANAIVASSLASSRAASPSRSSLAPPPPPRRGQHHLFHHDNSRTPSPSKPSVLRTTMRKPRDESEDEGDKRRGKKSHLMKKHPNKHHEGDRKRWRDVVTERERKRYEAVWASNRGLYVSTTPSPDNPSRKGGEGENSVNNLVVRDIFSRSRLHQDVLEEVYELVDRGRSGYLGKEEFVVGLWLIDQRLKGRKLPIRVQDSVWRSVGSNSGIKVRSAGK